ncbi:MAG: riboflavin synthase [Rickettsiales bacterium]|jgi:riboflavin synthase|nr:riboflavin synthase [Rickettsiales bacterium]
MFTGIISSIGTVLSSDQAGDLSLTISCPWDDVKLGESIACNGACLTVVEWKNSSFTVQLSSETLGRTSPRWNLGNKINLERAMKLGDSLDGHLVTGHVDGLAILHQIEPIGDSHRLMLEAPPSLSHFIAEKGSVTLDGVSLTVNKVDGNSFWVNIIPHTWQVTTLGERGVGDALNLEIDLIARYVERLLSSRA